MPETSAEVPVLIIGAGPVGLTARALLHRWGVPTLLVERYPERSPFPRSRLVNVRTMGHEVVDLDEQSDSVLVSVLDRASGETYRIRAGHVIAADGANSPTRGLLGIGTAGPGTLGEAVTIVFDADLAPWWGDGPAGVYSTARGGFLPVHPEGTWAMIMPLPAGGGPTEWRVVVLAALGVDVDVEVLRVQRRTMHAFVAERFAHGRVLLAGDAAHAIPPSCGLGMNIGVGDVHNLYWKLTGVLHGWAGPERSTPTTSNAGRSRTARRRRRRRTRSSVGR